MARSGSGRRHFVRRVVANLFPRTWRSRSPGRFAWQVSSSYNQRSRGETQIGRWKDVIGSKLKVRSFENQQRDARIGVQGLIKMTNLGRAEFEIAP